MKVEIKDNKIILKEVYNGIILETIDGKQLGICMRDSGFEMKLDNGDWHMIESESDFLIKPTPLQSTDPKLCMPMSEKEYVNIRVSRNKMRDEMENNAGDYLQ